MEKPVRPTPVYFKFRGQLLAKFKDTDMSGKEKNQRIKEEWVKIPESEKERLKDAFDNEYKRYQEAMQEWEAKHGKEQDAEKGKRRKKKVDDDDDFDKPAKSKGRKEEKSSNKEKPKEKSVNVKDIKKDSKSVPKKKEKKS